MSKLLNSYAYMYASYLMIYIYFLYDLLNIHPLRILLLSTCIILETLYVLNKIKEEKKQLLYFSITIFITSLLSFTPSFLYLLMVLYYLVIQVFIYFFIREDKEIENKHLWIPLVVGFAVSMYVYEFETNFIIEYMFSYFLIVLCAQASSNLDVYYAHRHISKEKKIIEYTLMGLVAIVSLFFGILLNTLQSLLSIVVGIIGVSVLFVFNLIIDVFGYLIGSIMAGIFGSTNQLELEIEVNETILGTLQPGQTQNVDFLKLIFQCLVILCVILVIRYVYKKYKEGRRVKVDKKQVRAYYQEIEDLEKVNSNLFKRFRKENISKIRKKYKKEVKRKVKEGYTFFSYFTPKDYLKTLPDGSLEELTHLYQEDRYGNEERN